MARSQVPRIRAPTDQHGALAGRERVGDDFRVFPRRQRRMGDREENGSTAGKDPRQQVLQLPFLPVRRDDGLWRAAGGGYAPHSKDLAGVDDPVIRSPARSEHFRGVADRRS
jgi:hypothetical protein